MLKFPEIDPVMLHLGPISVYWYGVAYMVGFLLAWQYAAWLTKCFAPSISKIQVDDFLMWALAGVVIGGRLGHILFFEPGRYLAHPIEIFMTWKGGMSFHGGMIGVTVAILIYCRKFHIPILRFSDILVSVVPIGLFLGRIANFINGELYGRVSDVSWAMVFPYGGPLPRHPSQLYEAFFEGFVLLCLLHIGWRIPLLRNTSGRLTGLFLLGYGLARYFVEFVRQPDTLYALLGMDLTTGQILSLPMIVVGFYLIWQPLRYPKNILCL